MVAESGRHPASKLLRGIPTLGAVRVAQLISVAATPHRFRYPPAVLVLLRSGGADALERGLPVRGLRATARDEEDGDAGSQAGS